MKESERGRFTESYAEEEDERRSGRAGKLVVLMILVAVLVMILMVNWPRAVAERELLPAGAEMEEVVR